MREPLLARHPVTGQWAPTGAGERSLAVAKAAALGNWIEQYLQVARKDRAVAHLRLNAAQALLLNYVAWCWLNGLAVMCLIPKSRQMGVSTFFQALAYARCIIESRHGRAFRAATIAHTEESSVQIFTISRRFERLLPKEWQMSLDSRQKGHMAWQSGSTLHIVSAKIGDAALKGVTIDMLHGSEVANWSDGGNDSSQLWSSALGALTNGKDSTETIVALESTAKGRDPFFYRMIQESRKKLSPYGVVFLPWYMCDDYRKTWQSFREHRIALGHDVPHEFEATAEEQKLRADVLAQPTAPGTEWWSHPQEITDEQLIWRRSKIEELEGKLEVFQRYFPSTLEECFSSTEAALFSPVALSRMWAATSNPVSIGQIKWVSDKDDDWRRRAVKWSDLQNGPVSVWAHPVKLRKYAIGADVSEGLATGDAQAAVVLDLHEHRVVCTVECRMEEDLYIELLYQLGLYYNSAKLAPENTFSPNVANSLAKNRYPNLHWHRSRGDRGRPDKPGFSTNKHTRHAAVEVILPALLRDDELIVSDQRIAAQAGDFVWNERLRSYRAPQTRHDDLVIALAIACYVSGWRLEDGKRSIPETEKAPTAERDGIAEWKREEAAMKARAKIRDGASPGCVL